ncbi:MAG TPA: hypothetical protein VNT01_04430 [Symbiobacteriaceae bacterium]|nr:hypothetical protein [Symbiobacteriaceae bacterium]
MRKVFSSVVLLALLLIVSGCSAKAQTRPNSPTASHSPHLSAGAGSTQPLVPGAESAPGSEQSTGNRAPEKVPEALVNQLLNAAHARPYSVAWEVGGNIDIYGYGNGMLFVTKGQAGIMPNGDRYVLLKHDGFVHKGDQAWYLILNSDGTVTSVGPEQGGLSQRPGIMMWEGVQPDQLGVVDAIARKSSSLWRTRVEGDTEVWSADVPPRKTSVELFRAYREVMEFNITVKKFDEAYLPLRFHLTWWDSGKIISFDGTYDWSLPVFPQVTEKAAPVQKSGG